MKIIKFLFLINLFFSSTFAQEKEYLSINSYLDKENYSLGDTVKLILKIEIKEKFHINSYQTLDPTLITTKINTTSEDFSLINTFFPQDKTVKLEFSEKELKVYEGKIFIGASFLVKENVKAGEYNLPVKFSYQACDDKACYPPKSVVQDLKIKLISENNSNTSLINKEVFAKVDFNKPVPNQQDVKNETKNQSKTENKVDNSPTKDEEQVSSIIEEKGLIIGLVLIFLGGLALNLTPCVYPLIPITISFFGAQGSKSKSQSILTGLSYVFGISITYSALGLFAALTGSLLGTALQNPAVVILVALIMLTLALSMFGVYEIRVPQKIALIGNKNRSGYFGALFMGLTVGFIAAPCIGPFVLSLLVYVGKLGNPFMGFILFFILSLGLGLPYIFLAASSSSISKLPRSGEWMEGIKIIFGFILIGMSIFTLQPLIPKDIYKYLFPLYIILASIYLILFDKKGMTSRFYLKAKYIIAIIGIIYGTWILKPTEGNTEKIDWQVLSSLGNIETSIKSANKPTMIDFYADWCAQCKELDEYTYTDKEIIDLSKSLNNIKIDLTQENNPISSKFDVKGLPVVIFLNSKGDEIKDLRVTGFLKPEEFKQRILKLKEESN